MAPPRIHTTQILVRLPPAVLAALDASIAGQSQRPSRPEEIRRLVKERLAGEPAPAPAAPSEDVAELRRQLIRLAGKVDGFVAYTRLVEAERDAIAARAARDARNGEAAQQSARETANVVRWPADGRSTPCAPPSSIRGSPSDPEAVARARAQLAAAEAEARRREEIDVQRS
jgi:hypothetical protein